MNDMLALDFSNTGYIYMFLIWSVAGFIGAGFAHKKGRNPFFWGILWGEQLHSSLLQPTPRWSRLLSYPMVVGRRA